MSRFRLRIIAGGALALLVLLVAVGLVGLRWTGGVQGRWGDLLLGVHPGQLRVGWSQDWLNETGWAHVRIERSTGAPALAFLGGQSFTTAPPHEIAIDLPVWLVMLPVFVILFVARRRLAALPVVPSCATCGYPIGASAICTECGAAVRREAS